MEYVLIIAMAAIAAVAIGRAAIKVATARQAQVLIQAQLDELESTTKARINELSATLAEANETISRLREENASLSTSITHLKEEREAREQQFASQTATRERQIAEDRKIREEHLEVQFRNLANDILRQNSADFKAQHEQRLEEILSPLRTNLDEFRKTVSDTYNNEARERFSLTEKIRELVELNNTISRETRELTHALRGNNQVQGDWGEMVLESILERSGLQEGEEYFLQVTNDEHGSSLRDESGKQLKPDVVVKYPDGRCVIIDSKVSLTAFVECANADNDKAGEDAAARHVKSVRSHVDELARKNYQNYIGEAKLDFVMMFIPNEPAYIAAMRHDPALWQDAYNRKVLIVSPTHLVSGLRLIEQLWSRDKVTKNAIKIAEDAGKMYDKFADFTKDMERISTALASAGKAHSDAMTKLSSGTGNLVKRAQDLRTLGIKASKQLAASLQSDDE